MANHVRPFIDPDWPDNGSALPMCDCNQPGIAQHPYGHEGFCTRKPWGFVYTIRKIRNKILQMVGQR